MIAFDGAGAAPLSEVLDLLSERIVRYRLNDLVVLYCNRAWALANGSEPELLIGRPLDTMLTPSEKEGMVRQLSRLGPDTPLLHGHLTLVGPDGWTEWTDRYLPGPDGPHVLAVGRDVSERRRAELRLRASEERYRELALHDGLTGLANRRLLDELLTAALARTRQSGTDLLVSYLDLDGFKAINDDHGHAVGDALLEEVSQRLRATVRGADVVARVGGDEFVVVQECPVGQTSRPSARLADVMTAPIVLGGATLECGVSIGSILALPEHDAGTLIDAADAAMYLTKRRHRRSSTGRARLE
ncbi:sensor domain-containing diguanylate cyclase [Pengzhenrongella frigida]|uniref:sensor domain-containing diguanylate cyclase n=1 Tax=Pengzhenrongella frigida TaxID=1259133 RepID=UPI0013EB767D|nr:sensor domain-containing diguanylate cyclase [Cellulomonas sp. HLT2-17]